MHTILLTSLTTLLLITPATPQCDRTFLNDLSALYLSAQTQGLPSLIPTLTPTSLTYTEQFLPVPLNTSILSTPLPITTSRRFIDASLCTSFTQSIILNTSHPYVIGTRMTGDAEGLFITNIDTLVTDIRDWGFDARGYEEAEGREEWGVIEEGRRDGREVLRDAADRYVIDEEVGVVNVFVGILGLDRNSSEPTPDSHTFRIEGGKIRYIHTLNGGRRLGCLVPKEGFL
ncbi:hypothetical protein DM02DRAFT_669122 [Periconia macrospinosa]|uniref:DUF8021 domain-containing protein n=1 Tax=Periconia macrospinosa TaxID=97972 RepID=A0A2V1E1J4_9PLEO|nr:hypothetical protein DM02DRAFT_669122 [Periconia macrospinosa]